VKKAGASEEKEEAADLQFRDALGMTWYSPSTLTALLNLLRSSAPSATKKFVVGNTSIGVYKDQQPDMWIYIKDIYEFQVRSFLTDPSIHNNNNNNNKAR
jgi:hypothetical protein